MKPLLLRFIFFVFVAIIQGSLVNILFSSWPISPPILLFSIVSFSMYRGFSAVRFWAVFAGFVVDAFSFARIGVSSIEYLIGSAIFGRIAKQANSSNSAIKLFCVGGAVWCFALVIRILEKLVFLHDLSESIDFLKKFFIETSPWMFLWSFLFSAMFFIGVFWGVTAFERYAELFERTRFGRR